MNTNETETETDAMSGCGTVQSESDGSATEQLSNQNEDTTMSTKTTESSEIEDEQYERIDTWEPESLPLRLEVGISGVCNHCDTDLVTDPTSVSRLKCTDCGYRAGLVIRFPELQDGGEPGGDESWPDQKNGWDIDDGRATFDIGFQGEHIGCGTFVENTKESQFGVPGMCCDGCGDQFGKMTQINTLVDPVNDIDHLE
ncbi:hypothetical protein [Halomontanus rarus]|uniref:hypothetical protein n=1 Tax=Halomontanus rarus TaxID=3034020 RepID=UPI00307CBB4D